MADGEHSGASPNEGAPSGHRWWVLVLVLVVVAGLATAIARPDLVKDRFVGLLAWTQGLAEERLLLSMGVIAVAYALACVLMLPGSILTLGAGFVLKTLWGTVTVSVGSTLGACAAFLVGRTIARRWIEARVAGNPKFAAIDTAVEQQGFKIVLLTRLSPVFPFNLLNYGFGLTKVRFRDYALASWIGMIPGTVMYVYFGAALGSLAQVAAGETEGGAAQKVFFWVGLVVAVVVAVFVARVARRALQQAIPDDAEEGQQ